MKIDLRTITDVTQLKALKADLYESLTAINARISEIETNNSPGVASGSSFIEAVELTVEPANNTA